MKVRVHTCRSRNWYHKPSAWLIMAFQKMKPWCSSSYNHMAISYIGQTGVWKYADSTFAHGVRDDQPEEEFLDRYKIISTKQLDVGNDPVFFKAWLEAQRGKLYDKWSILGLIGKLLNVFKRNPWGADFRKMICNELVLSMITRFYGVEIGDPDNYDLLMTEDLVDSL